jgi:hypothetical protein
MLMICRWVYAMFNYYSVAKEINPMRNAVKKAEQVLHIRSIHFMFDKVNLLSQ